MTSLGMLNARHPMRQTSLPQLEHTGEQEVIHTRTVPVPVTLHPPPLPQVTAVVQQATRSQDEWQAQAVGAQRPGCIGHFPTVAQLRMMRSGMASGGEGTDLVHLEAMSDEAQMRRRPGQEGGR